MPPVASPIADTEIPRQLWSSWVEAGKPRTIRRPLTGEEQEILERRRDELVPVLQPYVDREVNRVALAVSEMYDGFPSMRGSEEAAVGRVERVRHLLDDFPLWAIEKACRDIQRRGVMRAGVFDRKWPPTDPELVAEVREALRMYGDQHKSAVALLVAKVEQ